MVERKELLAPFCASLSDALVAVDFDGTLAPIVEDPASARPLDGAPQALAHLATRCGEVAVISGRPLSFLDPLVPDSVSVIGLYGLETRRHGLRAEHPNAPEWRTTMSALAERAEHDGPAGMDVELKGMSITLHYRRHPDAAPAIEAWARSAAQESGMHFGLAKMSFELHPPVEEDKGTVLRRLVADVPGPVLFAGDDRGDLPAFDVLDELASAGRTVLRVVVDSDECPEEVRRRADLLVEGPPAMAALLDDLGGC